MLIEFRVENHRSIRDEQFLTMEAGRSGVSGDKRPRAIPGFPRKILPVEALYGANASGKTNVLSAIMFMMDCVVDSHRAWHPERGIPRDPFAWGDKKAEPTSLEMTFVVKGVQYRYGFKFDDESFLEEWLYAWPQRRRQTWFIRRGEEYEFGDNLKGENDTIKGFTRSNALFMSAAVQFKHQQLTPIYTWFSTIGSFNMGSRFAYLSSIITDPNIVAIFEESTQATLFEDNDSSLLGQFKTLLRNADIGILDARMTRSETASRSRAPKFELKHQSESDDAWLPLEQESRGTQTLFRFAPQVLRTIQRGTVLVVDEIESSMHPNLAELIIKQFNNPRTNPRNAQLIFTTHDTNLLGTLSGEPVLRRDEVWLTEKDSKGATVLYPLTNYKPRKDENVERGYIQGRYGAIPFLSDFRISVE